MLMAGWVVSTGAALHVACTLASTGTFLVPARMTSWLSWAVLMNTRPASTGACPLTVSVTGPPAVALNRHTWSPLAAVVLAAWVAQSRISAVPPDTARARGVVAVVVTVKGPASVPATALVEAGVTVREVGGSLTGWALASATIWSASALTAAVSSVPPEVVPAEARLKLLLKCQMATCTAAASRLAAAGSDWAVASVAAAGCWSRMRLMFGRFGTLAALHGFSVIGSPEPARMAMVTSMQ